MYAETDPWLARLRPLALALPEAVEVESWGRPTFRAGKIFAVYGSAGEDSRALVVKPEDEERPALLEDPRFFLPPYFGPFGWVALQLDAGSGDPDELDWAEVDELLRCSYRQVALKRMIKALDALEA